MFELNALPKLVLLDREGNVLDMGGRAKVHKDRNGEKFPWTPLATILGKQGGKLQHKTHSFPMGYEGTEVDVMTWLESIQYCILWFCVDENPDECEECLGLIPKLEHALQVLRGRQEMVDVLFVSGQNSSDELKNFGGFTSLKAKDSRIGVLGKLFEIGGCCGLVVNQHGVLINDDVYGMLDRDEEADGFPWEGMKV
eukprot:TRINITY_DN1567_c0_g1_i2.p1 TRINITY_DN1567_c0_g1~~TRINITY_DN1567_c0_g1_i2.p1  ORF type:complete len:197 (+),score=58.88 TRINITY_DN1567_c0_g1_i2:117-707(+)